MCEVCSRLEEQCSRLEEQGPRQWPTSRCWLFGGGKGFNVHCIMIAYLWGFDDLDSR
jgi:hypothetical protein